MTLSHERVLFVIDQIDEKERKEEGEEWNINYKLQSEGVKTINQMQTMSKARDVSWIFLIKGRNILFWNLSGVYLEGHMHPPLI